MPQFGGTWVNRPQRGDATEVYVFGTVGITDQTKRHVYYIEHFGLGSLIYCAYHIISTISCSQLLIFYYLQSFQFSSNRLF